MKEIIQIMDWIKEHKLYPEMQTLSSGQTATILIDGQEKVMFCSNNYLNLTEHPEVVDAVVQATKLYGTGSGGSRLVSGTCDLHRQLEETIARFKERDDALIFSSGYMTNIGVLGALANPLSVSFRELSRGLMNRINDKTVVFCDELNHASIFDAVRIAGAKLYQYRHCDADSLRNALASVNDERKIIVTDGLFSMDGDIAPLNEIVELAKQYNAITIVDDAHATGILGAQGKGTAEYFGLSGKINIEIGTLNKVFGGIGGYVAADQEICDFLRVTSRTYIFSAALPPGVAAGLSKAVEIVRDMPALREKLISNILYMKSLLEAKGIPVSSVPSPIIPFILGASKAAVSVAQKMFRAGFFIPAIRWPAVPKGKARLRITLMAEHTKDQIEEFVYLLNLYSEEEGLAGKITTLP
jgi:8-amino-7-oxononanoate synthase